MVKKFIYPAIMNPPPGLIFSDQYAFRPTGSTTAALIATLQLVTTLLITNGYVHLIALDFSRAFDSVRHSTLLNKLSQLDIPDHAPNWFVDFFSERQQDSIYNRVVSSTLPITANVIQGSAVGPAAFVVCASDLSAVAPENKTNKYADDVILVIPASNSSTIHMHH